MCVCVFHKAVMLLLKTRQKE